MATILIIDDRPANRDYLMTLLGYGGHRLLQAGDGVEGLAIAAAQRPDLVITDILMPTMDGYEFVRLLRANTAISAIPVIFYTAHYREREARALAQEAGVFHVLAKPAEPEAVLRTVDAALQGAPVPAVVPSEEFDREHLRLLTDKLSENVDELSRANERLTALIELGLQLGSERDPRRLLESFCRAVREIIGARYAAVGIVEADGQRLKHYLTSGLDAAASAEPESPSPRHGVLAAVLEGRTYRGDGAVTQIRFPGIPPARSLLVAPLASPARVYGWLCLFDKVGAIEFSPEDERLTNIVAAQVGRIYENGSLYVEALKQASELEVEIGERKRAEAAWRENEERFRSAFDHTNVPMVLTDLDNRFVRVNTAFAQLFGYSEAEILCMSMADLTHPDHVEESYARREVLLAGGGHNFHMEKRYLHKDGHVLWGLTNVALVRDAEGKPLLYFGQVQDITERKQADEALNASEERIREAQQRLQHVITSSPAVLYTLACEKEGLRPEWISENLREMLGHPAESFSEPQWWYEHVHPDDVKRVIARVDHDLFTLDRVSDEFRFRNQNGTYRWIRNEMRLLRDSTGNPLEVVGSWSDITERKALEEQFRQAQKMEAVGQLAGGIAHDFNNLLAVINGYGEILLDNLPAHDPNRDAIGQIAEAGNRAAALTRQLLVLSRKAIVEPKVLDLRVVVADMDRMLRRIIGEDISLVTLTDPELDAVKADLGQLEQVLLNLAVNARDAMPQGGRLTIEVRNAELDETYVHDHPEARPGPCVLLTVSDTGCGMDAETAARIWEPFFTTKGDRGTGLGLATVYGIVKQSGGHIAVYSEVDCGTVFKIYLPREVTRPARTKSNSKRSTMPAGTETVLLAEDEDAVRALTRQILQACGYTILEARNGTEALQVCEQHAGEIDLLITDVVMPQTSGRELAWRLAAKYPGLKILFVSGYTDDAVVRHGILAAEVEFLQKPFSPAVLARRVREILDRA